LPPAAEGAKVAAVADHVFVPLKGADLERAKLLKPGQRMRDLPESLWHESFRRRAYRRVMDGTPTERRGGAPAGLRRLDGSQPSKAITGGALNEFLHPSADRPLTIRECARLQTFPDDFKFVGRPRDIVQLIGNAVPPLLAERIALSLMNDLKNARAAASTGALLTFVPTLSAGMSPALDAVTRSVRRRFGSAVAKSQLSLQWS
jgi:DNA (cytosine-5)-methyltransferase 1